MYRWKYHWVRSRSVGAGSAAIRATRGVEELCHPFDRAALAGGVPPLEEHDQTPALGAHPFLDLDQFCLQPEQLAFVEPPRQTVRRFGSLRPAHTIA